MDSVTNSQKLKGRTRNGNTPLLPVPHDNILAPLSAQPQQLFWKKHNRLKSFTSTLKTSTMRGADHDWKQTSKRLRLADHDQVEPESSRFVTHIENDTFNSIRDWTRKNSKTPGRCQGIKRQLVNDLNENSFLGNLKHKNNLEDTSKLGTTFVNNQTLGSSANASWTVNTLNNSSLITKLGIFSPQSRKATPVLFTRNLNKLQGDSSLETHVPQHL